MAGRNKALQHQLKAVSWEIPTRIYGFTDRMPELMKAADVLIIKAGPGTLSEAFIAGLPSLIFGYIPGQKKGNITYVQEHGAGAYAKTPAEVARLVAHWLEPNNLRLGQMADNAARLAKPEASLKIAAKLCSLTTTESKR